MRPVFGPMGRFQQWRMKRHLAWVYRRDPRLAAEIMVKHAGELRALAAKGRALERSPDIPQAKWDEFQATISDLDRVAKDLEITAKFVLNQHPGRPPDGPEVA